tara:strand:+ start:448 stop:1587 length:1140 start_codon:yes stop_codon:yes gene_type:complete
MGKSRNLAELGAGKLNTHLRPAVDSAYDLGHSDYKIRSLYVSGNTLFLGDSGSISAGPDGIEMPALKIGTGETKVILTAQSGGKLKIKEQKDSAGAPETAEVDFASEVYVTSSISSTVDSAYVIARASIPSIVDSAYVIARSPAITAGITSYIYTATANQTVFSGSDDNNNTLTFTSNNVFVNVNGVMIVETLDYTLTPSNTVTMVTGLSAGDQLSVTVFAPASSENLTSIFDSSYLSSRLSTIYPSEITQREYVYTAGAAQVTFTGADSSGTSLAYDSDNVEVFANGIRLFKSIDYTASNGTSIVLADSMGTGSSVVVVDRSSLFGVDITKSLNIGTGSIPATSTSTGIKGTVLTDANHMYVCTATNVWVRSSIDTSW